MSYKVLKRVLIGMDRPTNQEVLNLMSKRGIKPPYFWCPCFPPEITGRIGSFIAHLLAGHYDKPIYKYVFEEDGKIIESLENPTKNDSRNVA